MRPMRIPRTLACTVGTVVLASLLPAQDHATRVLGNPRVLQGPMLGVVDATTARIWMRLSADVAASVLIGREPDLADARESARVVASRANDRCVELVVDGLEPGTTWSWRPLVQGRPDKYLGGLAPFTLTTPPAGPARTRFAFGSCARFSSDREQPIWRAVAGARPDVFLWLGDNVYADTDDPLVLAEEYRRQRDVASLQPLLRSTPQLAIWDDHDFGLNDHDRTSPMRDDARLVFRRHWANPGCGTASTPGVFFAWSRSGTDGFFLDVRSWRDPNAQPDGEGKTMLGAGQLAWLKEQLAASTAPFKLIFSGSGWSAAKGPGGDSWASYRHERDALFTWIAERGIRGVVLVSGDTHVGELNCIPWSERGGYDLYELVSSPLAQLPETSWRERQPELRIRSVYARSENFGLIDVDPTLADPKLTFTLVDREGREAMAPLELRASELVPGVASWRSKIAREELLRLEARQRAAVEAGVKR